MKMNRNSMSSEIRERSNCCEWSRESLMHKYVLLCLICGSISLIVGSILIIVYVLMRLNTSSLQYFETIPTYIPATLLIANGLLVMCFAKSKTRFAYLIKMSGGSYLICALLCVVMTVTTTVIHMNRLQTHHECVYSHRIRSCTCISAIVTNKDSPALENNVAHHFTFEDIPNCEVVHGILFTCLRALFGLSVISILICIFSLMLVYQLLSHEKKKKYLQQLELRRRFHPQSRRLASHLSHPYVSSHLSPHLLAHNRNHSLRHTQYCNCSDDSLPNGWCLPPQSYDFIDYRSYYRNFEDDSQSNTAILGNRSHSWTNWLNWSRNHVPVSANEMLNHNSNRNANRGLLNLILRRNNNNQRVRESNGLNANTIQWRSLNTHNFLPPHVFIPRIGSGGLSTLPMHFSRYRDNNTHNLRGNLLSAMNSSHRRTRSNDGIFHHLNIGLSHNSANDYISCPPRATNVSSNVFALWGPPPPYTCSQPQSLNRINAICNNLNRSSQAQHRRESSIHSSDANQGSKMSTPISERRIRCNAFSSQGIRLTIEGNDNSLAPKSKGSCIVEIHVPYNEEQHNNGVHEIEELRNGQKKMNPSFNTLPNIKRNEHIIQINNFKSLSNIPLTFPNKLNSTQYESHASIINSDYELNKPKLEAIRNVFCSQISAPKSSLSSSTPNTTSDTTTEITSESLSENTENSTSAVSFPVDPPTDYKSTLIIHTPNTQSSPITDQSSAFAQRQVINGKKVKDFQLNNAQSMPNLSCILPTSASKSNTSTRSQPHFWDIHRIPSSGNTSTSQDFADFEFEFDEEPLKFAADLPHDHLETNSASNSISVNKSNSNTSSVTPEFIQPPTPFNTQNYFSTTSNATISPLSDPKADIIINVKGIQV